MLKHQSEILLSVSTTCNNQICVKKLEHKVFLFRIFQHSERSQIVTSIALLFSLNILQNQRFSYISTGYEKGMHKKNSIFSPNFEKCRTGKFIFRPCLIWTNPNARRGEICISPKTYCKILNSSSVNPNIQKNRLLISSKNFSGLLIMSNKTSLEFWKNFLEKTCTRTDFK